MKQITLLVITDGRQEYLRRTLASFDLCINPLTISRRIIVNDCPDHDFCDWIDADLDFDEHVRPLPHRRGFAGAIAAGWEIAKGADYVFHLEDDFIFTRHVDLRAMAAVLDAHPEMAQMALRRQPWNDVEQLAGGVVEARPEEYRDHHDHSGHQWLTHQLFFTTNPSLIPQWVINRGWPQVSQSEGVFGLELFQDPQVVCGYWGQRADPPWVLHIGEGRAGTGY
jgi:glycosyltransferase involved in cell wall biosynthesis